MRTYPLSLSLLALAAGLAVAQDAPPPPMPPGADPVVPAPPAPPAPSQQALELYRQASLCLHEKRFAEARELWDALATGFPHEALSAEARYWRARCLEHLGRFADARAGYHAILAEPRSGWAQDAREGLARLQLREGDAPQAIADALLGPDRAHAVRARARRGTAKALGTGDHGRFAARTRSATMRSTSSVLSGMPRTRDKQRAM